MYTVFTDGACAVHTTRCGGCAALVIAPDGVENLVSFHRCETTSQRMELSGAIAALNIIPIGAEVLLKTDSQYMVRGINERQKLRANMDLWESLKRLSSRRKVTFQWIRRNSEIGHARVDGAANTKSKQCPHA